MLARGASSACCCECCLASCETWTCCNRGQVSAPARWVAWTYFALSAASGRCLSLRGCGIRGLDASVPAEESVAAAAGRFGWAASVPAEDLADADAGGVGRTASVPAEEATRASDCAKALLASRENTRLSVTFDIIIPF